MRSRPKVTVYFSGKTATPGEPFGLQLVVESKSRTPVDYIETTLVGVETVTIGRDSAAWLEMVRLTAREDPKELAPGTHRYRYTLEIPRDATPSYLGKFCTATYQISVHVSVPWWPDRRATFSLAVAPVPNPLTLEGPEGEARIAASADGAKPGQVYVEASIDRDVLEAGAVLAGAVSVSNTSARPIRRVVVSLVTSETSRPPHAGRVPTQRLSAILVDGSPPEGEPIPFRLRVPEGGPLTFSGRTFALDWHLEARAEVAFAPDVVVNFPLTVRRAPPGEAPRAPGPYHTVGRDRFGRVWAAVATQLGMALDEDGHTLRLSSKQASLAVRRTYDARGYGLVLELAWPPLGVDLHVSERSWTDMAIASWHGPSPAAVRKLVMFGREPEQLAALFDAPLLDVLARYDRVSIEDGHARLSLPIAGTNAVELEQACRSALGLLSRFAAWPELVPPPRTMATALDAWRAFAERVGGVLLIGSVSVRSCAIGVDRFSVETHWLATNEPLATVVTFPFDPPLETAPREDSPSFSAATRELFALVRRRTSHLEITRESLSWRESGGVRDPSTLLPRIEETASLVRALRGRPAVGPYR